MKDKRKLVVAIMAAFVFVVVGIIMTALIVLNLDKLNKTHDMTVPIDDSYPDRDWNPDKNEEIYSEDAIVDITMFINEDGTGINEDNEIRELLAQKIGNRIYETYDASDEAIDEMIRTGELPDLIYSKQNNIKLYEAGCLVAWDEYLEMYPEIKALYSDYEWDQFRMDDGHIYWADIFGEQNDDMRHDDYAFWIQVRVLEELGYPKIETVSDYFEALEKYYKKYPTLGYGRDIIPFTMLGNDPYILESPTLYFDEHANEGLFAIDFYHPDDPYVEDCSVHPSTEKYYEILNEEYKKGILDPEFETQTYEEYIAKLESGCVLGVYDSYSNFGDGAEKAFQSSSINGTTLSELGCDYVPLGLSIYSKEENRWHVSYPDIDFNSGVAVTTSYKDARDAFRHFSESLREDVNILRFWGIEGEDYLVDKNGFFYRTEEMRELWEDESYLASHVCRYGFCPQLSGMTEDGINFLHPEDREKTDEFFATLPEPVANCLKAYDVHSFGELMGSVKSEMVLDGSLTLWARQLDPEGPEGAAFAKMNEVKAEFIPKLITSNDFDKTWDEYETAYNKTGAWGFYKKAREEFEKILMS